MMAAIAIAAAFGLMAMMGGTGARATSSVQTLRVGGSDRYDTARLIAEAAFPNGATNAIVATGENYPDALAGSYLAGFDAAPILLTGSNSVPAPLASALSTLKVKNVVLLGGLAAISQAVQSQLSATASTNAAGGNLSVTRIGGADRYETAKLSTDGPGAPPASNVGVVSTKRTAIVATGENFPDATSAGVMAYAAKLPLLLTPHNTLAPATATALTDLNIKAVLIIGGPAAVSSTVESQIAGANGGITITRLQGADRNATATAVASYETSKLSFKASAIDLARGDAFPDALVGAPHAARQDAVSIVLTAGPGTLSLPTAAYLDSIDATLAKVTALGGLSAISDDTLQAAGRAATCGTSTASSTTPTTAATTTTTNPGLPTTLPTLPIGNTTSTTAATPTTAVSSTSSTVKPCQASTSTSSTAAATTSTT